VDAEAILYADRITGAMERAMAETRRGREKQQEWNAAHRITPESIKSNIMDILDSPYEKSDRVIINAGVAESAKPFVGSNFQPTARDLETRMFDAGTNLEFEEAARLRDELKRLKLLELEFATNMISSDGAAAAEPQAGTAAKAAANRHRRR
jgi:excinuclease ABC subunit B